MRKFLVALCICAAIAAFSAVDAAEPDDLYREPLRPQVHFSPPQQWMNDPNGMVFYDGEYHLFYQYHPYGNRWGPMHWGHAVSRDLVRWENLPIGLFPDRNGAIWSGSAVVDWNNTSGFGEDGKPPLVAIFTYHDHLSASFGVSTRYQSQGIAYSNDNGRNWTMYEGNPVLESPGIRDFRDPKVFWYEPNRKWVMSLAVRDHIRFYSSPDLKTWTHTGSFGEGWGSHVGVWECPDLIRLPIVGETTAKYVLLVSVSHGGPNGGSATQYFVGDFDGNTFSLDPNEAERLKAEPEKFPNGELFDAFDNSLANWESPPPGFGILRSSRVDGPDFTVLTSGLGGDDATGVIRSRRFDIEKPFLNFRISGGKYPDELGLRLIVDGETVMRATGDRLPMPQVRSWDVSDYLEQEAFLEVFDQRTGGWGQVSVDDIVFADAPAAGRDAPARWVDFGTDNYAGVTWSDIPTEDGRTLFIGWMSNWFYAQEVPTDRWRSAMTVPRSLSLYRTERGLEMASAPVDELELLRADQHSLHSGPVKDTVDLSDGLKVAAPFELDVSLDTGRAERVEIGFANEAGEKIVFALDKENKRYELDRSASGTGDFDDEFLALQTVPWRHAGREIDLRFFVDTSSVEVFVNDGETVLTAIVFPSVPYDSITLSTDKSIILKEAELSELASIWYEEDSDE